MKNILCDFHNKDLLVSLYFLFVKRLGYNLYIPTGRDWFDEEYWSLVDGGKNGHHSEFAAALCHQFLEHTSNFLDPVQKEINNSVKTITLNEFKDQSIQFDIVLSSVPATLLCFKKLRKFQPNFKEVFQCGNNHDHRVVQNIGVNNLLSSAIGPYHFLNCHKVFYHSEFDLNLVRPSPNYNKNFVMNLCHMSTDQCWDIPRKIFYDLESNLINKNWKFKFYGLCNRDGILPGGVKEMSDAIKQIGFLYHNKIQDEGYGINIHYAFACGKPVITDTTYMTVVYDRSVKNTASLLFDDDTIIDIKDKSTNEIIYELEKRSDNYEYYSNKVYAKFKEVVNFDRDQKNIEKFIENLI